MTGSGAVGFSPQEWIDLLTACAIVAMIVKSRPGKKRESRVRLGTKRGSSLTTNRNEAAFMAGQFIDTERLNRQSHFKRFRRGLEQSARPPP